MNIRKIAYALSGSMICAIGFISFLITLFTMINVSDWYNGLPLLFGSIIFMLVGSWLLTKYISYN